MDKTTKDIINLYSNIISRYTYYISEYHATQINRWNEMLIQGDINNDEFKKIRNMLYGLFILLESSTTRNNFIDYCLETIKTHNDNSISTQYLPMRELFDNFEYINKLSDVDYGNVVELLRNLYNGYISYHERGLVVRHIAIILRKYDIMNKYILGVLNPATKQDIDLDDVVQSIYDK